jgi:hypothetical protein
MKRKTDGGQNAHPTGTGILRIYKGDLNFEFQLLSFLPKNNSEHTCQNSE